MKLEGALLHAEVAATGDAFIVFNGLVASRVKSPVFEANLPQSFYHSFISFIRTKQAYFTEIIYPSIPIYLLN